MNSELWQRVPSHPRYMVSSLGRIASTCRGAWRILVASPDTGGYPVVRLYGGKSGPVMARVHRLTCEAFNGPPNALHRHVAHLDGDRANGAADNLKWVSPPENAAHKRLHGTHQARTKHPSAVLSEQDVSLIRSSGLKHTELAKALGVKEAAIRKIRKGSRWRGFPQDDAHD